MVYYVYEYYVIQTNEVFYVGKGKGNRAYTGKRNKFCEDMKRTHEWGIRIIQDKMSERDAYNKEIELIKYYRENTSYRITNQTDGGDGTNGWIATEEFKEKARINTLTRWKDEEFREKWLSIIQDENGVFKSKEFREKMSKLVTGENNPNYGNRWSDEQKEHLSKVRIENQIAKGEKNPRAKKIMCVETGEIFECISYAMEKYPVKANGSYSVALDKKERTACGYHWITINDNIPNDEERFKYLLECLMANTKKKAYICVETKEIFNSRKQLMSHLGCGLDNTKKIIKNKLHNGQEYLSIEEYYSRIY